MRERCYKQAEWHGWNDHPEHGVQNAKRNARNDQITGRGTQTREAGTDVSWPWRNGASVQQADRLIETKGKGTTTLATMMAECGSLAQPGSGTTEL